MAMDPLAGLPPELLGAPGGEMGLPPPPGPPGMPPGLPPELMGMAGMGPGGPLPPGPEAGQAPTGAEWPQEPLEILGKLIEGTMQYMSVETDNQQKAVAATVLASLQKLLGQNQKENEQAMGVGGPQKAMARMIGPRGPGGPAGAVPAGMGG